MKIRNLILLSVLVLTACGQAELTLSNGQPANLADYRGQWLLVNYYADWCKPCIKELPALDKFGLASEQRQVIAVSYDNLPLAELQTSWQQRNVSFLFARVEVDDFTLPRPKVLPTTYVLNPQGELVQTLVGEQDLSSLNQHWQSLSAATAP
ncbi:TlpA disulfide reductase family protein [Motilimonas sp. E26]|uniref:TlpA family protein disulfide reductase n=1 Tax=Motilimonas sp. E26 TaxID=2865674 RepID=UPI001E4159CD|nr:TlpA disulfide reductase family protein [Motilimonas sp. E26]